MSDKYQFILKPLKKEYPIIFVRNRVLTVGRSETCDYTVNNQFLSFVHASLLKKGDVLVATDLDSTNGIFLNDEKVSTGEFKPGDVLRFGSVRYNIEYRELKTSYPGLPEDTQTKKILNDEGVLGKLANSEAAIPPKIGKEKSYDATSLIQAEDLAELRSAPKPNQEQTIVGLFPQFEFSEFIFEEDISEPAFDFDNREACLEITSLFGNCIHEVDYFKMSEKELVFTAGVPVADKVSLPIIGLSSDLKIAESIGNGRFKLLKTDFFDYKVFSSDGVKSDCFLTEDTYELEKNDLVIISNENLNIYLKQTDSPPTTLKVKYFDRDKLLFLLFSFFSLLWLVLFGLMLFLDPPKKKPEDPADIIKKIDRILYKKKIVKPLAPKLDDEELSDKPEKDNTLVDPKNKESEIVEDEPKIEEAKGAPVEEETEDEPTQVESKDNVKERVVSPSPPAPAPEPIEKPQPVQAPKVTKKIVRTSLKAKKVIPPATKIKSLTSKYSQALGDLTSNTSGSSKSKKLRKSITQTNASKGKQDISFVKNKERKSDVLRGKKIGDFGSGQVTTGSAGKVIGLRNSVGRRTVILGQLDPRDIQNVLRQHLPRFGYCYDRELERRNKRFSTTIDLKFTIYANGRAKKPSFTSKSITFSANAIKCLRRVMSTIQFPKPRGGGIVKVRQPINLEPK